MFYIVNNPGEILPPSLPNLHFPYGDIDDGAQVQNAHAWLDSCENMQGSHEQRIRKILYNIGTSTQFWNAPIGTQKIYKQAMNVCDTWDEREHPGQHIARMGFEAAHSIVIRSNIFPSTFADFSTELENMKNPENTNVRSFGAAAWNGMKVSYPNLFKIHDRLNDMLTYIHNGLSTEDIELQKAGIGLSSTLGAYSRLDEFMYHYKYTGVKRGIDTTKSLVDMPVRDWIEY